MVDELVWGAGNVDAGPDWRHCFLLGFVSRSGVKVFGAESLADEVSGQIPQRREQPEEPKGQRWVLGGVVVRVLGMQTTHRSRLNSLGEAGR